jgi:2-polyprenyl-3-methyl-5-hydroxy-6-metoxy-1,4-benzoquinol methylase
MDIKTHWEKVYGTKTPETLSWYRRHLEISLMLLERTNAGFSSSIIDVGGGESTLVDDLLLRGYMSLAVLDISQTAIEITKKRLGSAKNNVRWLIDDVLVAELEPHAYDIWHDRAVFHFLTGTDERVAYVRQVMHAVRPGGHVIVSTFGSEGLQDAVDWK